MSRSPTALRFHNALPPPGKVVVSSGVIQPGRYLKQTWRRGKNQFNYGADPFNIAENCICFLYLHCGNKQKDQRPIPIPALCDATIHAGSHNAVCIACSNLSSVVFCIEYNVCCNHVTFTSSRQSQSSIRSPIISVWPPLEAELNIRLLSRHVKHSTM